MGLMYRNEDEENRLKADVVKYLQGLLCQMALAAQIAKEFQKKFAPSHQAGSAKDQFDVLSDDDPVEGENMELNVIVATKVIEDKSKEAGMHTVKPLLAADNIEESKTTDDQPIETSKEQVVIATQEIKTSTQQLRKAKRARDKDLKDVFAFESRYNIKFLAKWSQTENFKEWLATHDNSLLASLSP